MLVAAATIPLHVAAFAQSTTPQATPTAPRPAAVTPAAPSEAFQALCSQEGLQRIRAQLPTGVTLAAVPNAINGPPGGVRYVAANGSMPAYCQISGSFVTNPANGRTANFLAALPLNWTGRYLQVGCSSLCGQFYVSDVTLPLVTISIQGRPGDALSRGYAAFATDEGHLASDQNWAVNAQQRLNREALEDLLYRAQMVLSHMGKDFTRAFYTAAGGPLREIARSYFAGCSGGGRDALVAASYFPEAFDGIIAGSPYRDMTGAGAQVGGLGIYATRPEALIPPELLARVDPIVKAGCDQLDGVRDGLIQNPAACNFRPERDLPRCTAGQTSNSCFTEAQIRTISTFITALTDERGNVVQPGYSVSELQTGAVAGHAGAAEVTFRVFAHDNDPNFQTASILTQRDGGPGPITQTRIVIPSAEVSRAEAILRRGSARAQDAARLIQLNRRLLIWVNNSDEQLAPNMTRNYYVQLAGLNGGYDRLQRNVRLFNMPGTAHCSMSGVGPTSFDALGAMEAWVERGQAPNAMVATSYRTLNNPGPVRMPDYSQPLRSMPLCMFPQMARYSGRGDVNSAQNWSCPANDRRMLTLGENGIRAGLLR